MPATNAHLNSANGPANRIRHSSRNGQQRMPKWNFLLLAVSWTILLAVLAGEVYHHAYSTFLDVVTASARDTFSRDLLYRLWAAEKGGLYVPVSAQTPPNPYLSHVFERDVSTPSGRQLTLVNPAYMTRQVHELGQEQYGLRGRISSLRPLRPENLSDEWEKEALLAFERGAAEVFSLETLDNELFLRFMRPMVTEQMCLKCHAGQGYKVGDIQGGISVSVPWSQALESLRELQLTMLYSFGPIWVLGMLALIVGRYRTNQDFLKGLRSEADLRDSLKEKEMLLREVHHRVKNNLAVVSALLDMQRQSVVDPESAAALMDLDGRIKSMALVHEKLYSNKNLAWIDFQDYLETFLQELRSSFDMRGCIRCIAAAHGVRLGLDLAIPCGMIVNELVTNAFKYAFPGESPCDGRDHSEINVSMRADNEHYTLVVADNGVGLPLEIELLSAGSYGLRIVKMIAIHQLRGRIEVDRTEGTRITITFDARQKET
jgi:two-component sensor histidine kinase